MQINDRKLDNETLLRFEIFTNNVSNLFKISRLLTINQFLVESPNVLFSRFSFETFWWQLKSCSWFTHLLCYLFFTFNVMFKSSKTD